MQLPEAVHAAVMAACMAANIATSAYPMLSIANARLIAAFGSPGQIERFALPQIRGEALGTMCLSEPHCGSSLADITTRAVPDLADASGPRYRLTGNKMWISAGDHDITPDIIHLVLAKIPDEDGSLPSGTRGISLFIVPKRLADGAGNDVTVAGLNHKMGYRGTSNCLLNFGEGIRHRPEGSAGAIGWRVGEPSQGLAQMFQMMNEARIAVGLGAAAVACRAHRLSVAYAMERRQGRPVDAPKAAPVAIVAHPDVRRMLLAQKCFAEGALALTLYCARLVDDMRSAPDPTTREESLACLGLLTPVAKTWPSEWGLLATDLAIQVHGGYGYTRDFDVEQLYRDSRLNPIHEGTTGIQAIDLVRRKIRKAGARSLGVLRARIDATVARAAPGEQAALAGALSRMWDLVEATALSLQTRGEARSLWHATDFLSAFGHAVLAWIWLDQFIAAARLEVDDPHNAALREAKRRCCTYFFAQELPRVALWLSFVQRSGDEAASCPETILDV